MNDTFALPMLNLLFSGKVILPAELYGIPRSGSNKEPGELANFIRLFKDQKLVTTLRQIVAYYFHSLARVIKTYLRSWIYFANLVNLHSTLSFFAVHVRLSIMDGDDGFVELRRCASTMWMGTHLTHLSCAQKVSLLDMNCYWFGHFINIEVTKPTSLEIREVQPNHPLCGTVQLQLTPG